MEVILLFKVSTYLTSLNSLCVCFPSSQVLGISVYQPASIVEETDSGPPPPTKIEPEATDKKEDDKQTTEENGEKKKEDEEESTASPAESLTQAEKDAKIVEDLPDDVQSILQVG